MIDATELQTMLDTLDRAIFAGARKVQFADRLVEYQSMGDMRNARADLAARIGTANNAGPSSFSLARHSRD